MAWQDVPDLTLLPRPRLPQRAAAAAPPAGLPAETIESLRRELQAIVDLCNED